MFLNKESPKKSITKKPFPVIVFRRITNVPQTHRETGRHRWGTPGRSGGRGGRARPPAAAPRWPSSPRRSRRGPPPRHWVHPLPGPWATQPVVHRHPSPKIHVAINKRIGERQTLNIQPACSRLETHNRSAPTSASDFLVWMTTLQGALFESLRRSRSRASAAGDAPE